jgi:hypothetical protein
MHPANENALRVSFIADADDVALARGSYIGLMR